MDKIEGTAILEAPLHGKLPIATIAKEAVHEGEPANQQALSVAALAPLKVEIVRHHIRMAWLLSGA